MSMSKQAALGRPAKSAGVNDVRLGPDTGAALEVIGLRKRFKRSRGDVVNAVDDVNLSVARGEFVVLLGPSGCGKTTLLRSVAGLEEPDDGSITIGGQEVFSGQSGEPSQPAERRRLSMMFQSYALWPHMDVAKNVGYPLRMRKVKRDASRSRTHEALARVGVSALASEYPHALSGGQAQRVALARAIVADTPLILFDEPLSNVDAKVRSELRAELSSLQADLEFAALYVTHDQAEAMEIGHRIAVMRDGGIVQIGSAHDIYEHPADRYVANFVGMVNEIEGKIVDVTPSAVTVETRHARLSVQGPTGTSGDRRVGQQVVVAFRPEAAAVDGTASDTALHLHGTLERLIYLGTHSEALVRTGTDLVRVSVPNQNSLAAGDTVEIRVPHERLMLLNS